jgi:hypothetical protein
MHKDSEHVRNDTKSMVLHDGSSGYSRKEALLHTSLKAEDHNLLGGLDRDQIVSGALERCGA